MYEVKHHGFERNLLSFRLLCFSWRNAEEDGTGVLIVLARIWKIYRQRFSFSADKVHTRTQIILLYFLDTSINYISLRTYVTTIV